MATLNSLTVLKRNHLVQIDAVGPNVGETSSTFRDYEYKLTVNPPSGNSYEVDGFFNADGDAANSSANSGNVWSARIAPKEVGDYSCTLRLNTGTNLSASGGAITSAKILHFSKSTGFDYQTKSASLKLWQTIGSEIGATIIDDQTGVNFDDLTNLNTFNLIVFSNTTGEPLTASQRTNLETYINGGGNVISIHGAADAFRHSTATGDNSSGQGVWDFFAERITGYSVNGTPKQTPLNQNSISKTGTHASTNLLPDPWVKFEEWLYEGYRNPNFTEVLQVAATTGTGTGNLNDARTVSQTWTDTNGGGKRFFTMIGSQVSDYELSDNFRNHLRDAALWMIGAVNFASAGFFDGETIDFTVAETDATGDDFRARGALEYVGQFYPRTKYTGDYEWTVGPDSPESILNYSDIDGSDDPGRIGIIHNFSAHASNWQSGDPEWGSSKGHALIGLLKFVASTNCNILYGVQYGIDTGDGGTYPWVSGSRDAFDVSKLEQWRIILDYANQLGIQFHFVFSESENHTTLSDEQRRLYFKEMIARFGYLPAVKWNIGEEPNAISSNNKKRDADLIRAFSQHNHPIAYHTHYDVGPAAYNDTLGHPTIDASSFQGFYANGNSNSWPTTIRNNSDAAGHKMMSYYDEINPATTPSSDRGPEIDRIWWTLTGGGAGLEFYFGGNGGGWGDQHAEDLTQIQDVLEYGGNARLFLKSNNIPFWEMAPDNSKVGGGNSSGNTCFYKDGEHYVVYLPNGGSPTVNLSGHSGKTFDVFWVNPYGTTGALQTGSIQQVQGGSNSTGIGSPPGGGKYVAYLRSNTITPENCTGIDYLEDDNGQVVINVDDNQGQTGWQPATASDRAARPGYKTSDFLIWRGGDFPNTAGNGVLSYKVKFKTTGIKYIKTYMRPDPNAEEVGGFVSDGNDFWLRVPRPAGRWNEIYAYSEPPFGNGTTYYAPGNEDGLTPIPPGPNPSSGGGGGSAKVLVFTKTNGHNHNTAGSVQSMYNDFASQDGYTVVFDNDGSNFNSLSNLNTFTVIVFANTSGYNILNSSQRQNFEDYIAAGGSLMGIHAATDTERHSTAGSDGGNNGGWDFFAESLGGSVGIPKHGNADVLHTLTKVIDHPSVANINFTGNQIDRREEVYRWGSGYLAGDINVILTADESGTHEHSWYRDLAGGGKSFYTAMGHSPNYYTGDSIMRQHIKDATKWLIDEANIIAGSGGGWWKIFDNFPVWQRLRTQTGDGIIDAFIRLNVTDTSEIFDFQLSGRSPETAVNTIEIFDLNENSPPDNNSPETPCTGSQANRQPNVSQIANQTNQTGDNVNLQVQASDPDGDQLSYAASNLPPGLSINISTGLISGSPTSVGSYNVVITVTDNGSPPLSRNISFNWNITTSTGNQPPSITPIVNQATIEGGSPSYQVQATDPDGDTISYSATGLPSGLSINPSSGLISGTLTAPVGTYSVTVTVTDDGSPALSSSESFTWTVTTSTPPGDSAMQYSFDGRQSWQNQPEGFVNLSVPTEQLAQHGIWRRVLVNGECVGPEIRFEFPPTVQNDNISTQFETAITPYNLNTLASDPLTGALTYAIQTQPGNGTASINGTNLSYLPNNGFTGSDQVVIRATNLRGISNNFTISIEVGQQAQGVNAVIKEVSEGGTHTVVVGCGAVDDQGNPLQGDTKVIKVFRGATEIFSTYPGGQSIDQGGLCHTDSLSYNGNSYGTGEQQTGDEIHLIVTSNTNGATDTDIWEYTGSQWQRQTVA